MRISWRDGGVCPASAASAAYKRFAAGKTLKSTGFTPGDLSAIRGGAPPLGRGTQKKRPPKAVFSFGVRT